MPPCPLSKGHQLGGRTDTLQDTADIQWDLALLERKSSRNLMKFNSGKCKVLHLGQNKSRNICCWGPDDLGTALQKCTWES